MLEAVLSVVDEALQYDRAALGRGELWRLVTSHFVHFGFEHFLWDAAVFAVLLALTWRMSPWRCLGAVTGAVFLIPPLLWTLDPGLETYRGLSGLDAALFVTAALILGRRSHAEGRWPAIVAAVIGVIGFVAKVGFEVATGQAVFVNEAALGFTPVPLAHAAGAAAGVVAAFWAGGRSSRKRLHSRGRPVTGT
jgi:rhomboid family GlyGly-CTERM serine protease